MLYHLATLAAVLFAPTVAPAAAPDDPPPKPDALQRELASLQARVRELEFRQTAVDDELVRQTVSQVAADARQRSQLVAVEGFTAGWDNGFVLRSADGAFALKPGVLFQFRSITDYRQAAPPEGDDDIQHGFEVRRVSFTFQGSAFTPNFGYSFMWEAGKDGSVSLLDAFITYKIPDTRLTLKAGQYYDPVTPELRDGPPRRLAVEPSVSDFLIAGGREDRVQGASMIYGGYAPDLPINLELMLHDGLASKNTSFLDGPTHFGVSARAEAKCFGDWGAYKDFTAAGNKNDLLVFGVGGDYTDADNGAWMLGQIDAQWEPGKLAVYGALLARYVESRNTAADDALDFGCVAQAAYLLTDRCEGFVRYSLTEFDNPPADTDDAIHEICVGANYYLIPAAPHRAKVTVDLTYLPNGAPPSLAPFGISGDTDDAELVLRGQFQLFL